MAYSEEDLNAAVAAGALSAEAATSFRNFMTQVREIPRGSEENFRLINSFNDIFVAIGIVILIVAVAAIGDAMAGLFMTTPVAPDNDSAAAWDVYSTARDKFDALQNVIAAPLIAGAAWLLAEFFTKRRRMALPSIILLLCFVVSIVWGVFNLGLLLVGMENDGTGALVLSLAGLVGAAGAFVHWRRFMVPITIAAGTAAAALTIVGLIVAGLDAAGVEDLGNAGLVLSFVTGLAVFAFAMRWDISDRTRISRRSDVAFWLHLLAAPLIAHPLFYSLGLFGSDDASTLSAVAALAIYIVFGFVAVLVDRRALLVSALAYVLVAMGYLFDKFGAVELAFALTALVIGSALLTLSAFWQPIRRVALSALPQTWRDRLPDTEDAIMPGTAAVPAQ